MNEIDIFEYKQLNLVKESKLKKTNSSLSKTLFLEEEKILSKYSSNFNNQKNMKYYENSNLNENKQVDLLLHFISKLDENYHKIHLINIQHLVFKLSFYDGFDFLNERTNSRSSSSMGVKVEVNKVNFNLSIKSILNLINTVIQLILIGKKDEILAHKIDQENLDDVIPIERIIFSEMQNKMKKFKLLLKEIKVNFKSENNLTTDFIIKISKFAFLNINNLIYTIDPLSPKISNKTIDLRFQDISILVDEYSYIMNVPNYNLIITEDIYYLIEKKESQIRKSIAADLSNFFVFSHTEKFNKILENVIEIVDGVDKIDCLSVELKKIEKYNCNSEINLNFKNFALCLFNENLHLNIRNLTMNLKIDQIKFGQDDISISFSPFLVTLSNPFDTNIIYNDNTSRFNFHEKNIKKTPNPFFDKRFSKFMNDNNCKNKAINSLIFETNEFYYVSDIILSNFKIEINENKVLSNCKYLYFAICIFLFSLFFDVFKIIVKITFGILNLRIYDNQLIDMLAFIPEFLRFVFVNGKKNRLRMHKNKPRPFKSNKQDKVTLFFETVNLVKIIDYEDTITTTFNDFELLVDKVK